ncbi:hypothetical protein KSZ_18220 [Dictyobacter formicarum]|uniref:Uncharacterized protein n=1 Tax=Dictyobacter formicarum TaxID=2778368 RepID=A0ABQ3VE92_9CHLR|nr:hypothetical protein KSZ_18220 [Dictyobacter formicarum]
MVSGAVADAVADAIAATDIATDIAMDIATSSLYAHAFYRMIIHTVDLRAAISSGVAALIVLLSCLSALALNHFCVPGDPYLSAPSNYIHEYSMEERFQSHPFPAGCVFC